MKNEGHSMAHILFFILKMNMGMIIKFLSNYLKYIKMSKIQYELKLI